ncbi:hypothetical protein MVEN_01614300 [Mycena venus]|uniref:Uncharacterized protein n=1 Tax=Mycena venus TaxID=2733690 RepID=A0A8H6XTA3_9AGAR|nr:hypothetical protein MVEN_01614300 [Mycena venus]
MPPRTTGKRKHEDHSAHPNMTRCPTCREFRDRRGFSQHRQVCRTYQRHRDQLQRDAQILQKSKRRRIEDKLPEIGPHERRGADLIEDAPFPLPSDMLQDAPMPEADPMGAPPPHMLARLPSHFILSIPHPHSGLPSTITPLDQPPPPDISCTLATGFNPEKPFAPFRTYADYHFTSRCVREARSDKEIKAELDALHNGVYFEGGQCKLTIRTPKDMSDSLRAARQTSVQFKHTCITVDFQGETDEFRGTHEVEIDFRDPWEVTQSWVCDETLASRSTWFSVRKYYCRSNDLGISIEHQEPLFDEPWTGTIWHEVDNELPDPHKTCYPSCYLPHHIWLDKGQVSTKVKKHPIVLRGLWIESIIRNSSGNGGGALLGYVIMPPHIRNIDPKNLNSREREDYTKLKGIIYNVINTVILRSLKRRSHYGDTFRFGDGVYRTVYPGFLIESMDFQELTAWLGMRSSQANFPCPKNTAAMRDVIEDARCQQIKGDKEDILRSSGLHDVEQILWEFGHSDPYKAVSYDTLHWDDGGKFGRHLWVYIKQVLTDLGKTNEFNKCMAEFPCWRGLEHFSAATAIDFTEGNAFLALLKCIVPCLVHILPPNSPLVHALRAFQQFRTLVGMDCTLDSRLQAQDAFVGHYEIACRDLDKNFNFLKQHYTCHASSDIREKGATKHMST